MPGESQLLLASHPHSSQLGQVGAGKLAASSCHGDGAVGKPESKGGEGLEAEVEITSGLEEACSKRLLNRLDQCTEAFLEREPIDGQTEPEILELTTLQS